MARIRNIVAVVGEYEKNGETKKQYLTIGKLIEREDGKLSVKIDAIPTGWNGRANIYDINTNKDKSTEGETNVDDDPPF